MDPVSHLAFGRTLIALARADPRNRGTIGAAVLGSLAPDLDAVVMPFGWDRYLRVHAIGTHALAGTFACALATAALVRWKRPETAFIRLLAAAWVGTLSHVILDFVSGARLRLAWPLTDRDWTLPLVAMADPILLGLLVASIVALVLAGRSRHRTAAAIALGGIGLFLVVKGGLALSALTSYDTAQATRASRVESRAVEARWASLREWRVFDRTEHDVRAWLVSPDGAEMLLQWPRAEASGLAAASTSLPTVRNFLHTHDLAIVTIVPQAGGRQEVLWSDIRYCWDPHVDRLPDDQPVARLADGRRLACGLWFGGSFDQGGQAIRQIVRIGAIVQTRSIN